MQSREYKAGDYPPAYREVAVPEQARQPSYAQTRKPWWNPRYWRKPVWAAVIAAVLVVLAIVIAVPVVVTRQQNNSYPDYAPVSYRLAETRWFSPKVPPGRLSIF